MTGGVERPRICFVMNSIVYGGVEAHVALLCGELRRAGYEPLVMCPKLAALQRFYDELDALAVPYRYYVPQRGALAKAISVIELANRLRAERVDLVHVQLIFTDGGRVPMLAARLARLPVVVTHHAAQRASLFKRWGRRPVLALVDEFVAVSRANRADQIRDMGLRPERVTAIHNGIPVPEATPDRRRAHDELTSLLGLPTDAKLVGAVGRLASQKGFSLLLDAVAAIARDFEKLEVLIVGEGPLRSELEGRAARLGLGARTHFLGFRNDASALIAGFDVLAMPSLFEGLPLALVEAFAVGCPTVATAVDGIPEVIDDEVNGLLVPPGDAARLGAALGRVLCDDAFARRIGAAAREKALAHFTTQRMVRETAALYAKHLQG